MAKPKKKRAPKRWGTAQAPLVPANELREFIEGLGITPTQFADWVGISGPTIRRWLQAGGEAPGWVGVIVFLVEQLREHGEYPESPQERAAMKGR